MENEGIINDQILESNQEIVDYDLTTIAHEEVKIYSRDWTVQTICDQILRGNIDLNPKFQRRNAWNDKRRSLLIESLILDLPVPEIVLAENHEEKDKFIVLDGKQRLLTILGFIQPQTTNYWDSPKISTLEIKKELNGKSYEDLSNDANLAGEKRALENASIRCTVIFGQKSDDLLYQIFYRLNSTSVPLSMQELRFALRKGGFSDFLIDTTNNPNKLQLVHYVLGISEPDRRLLDTEIILKFIVFRLFSKDYQGNLKLFLDNSMKKINIQWKNYEKQVKQEYDNFNSAIEKLKIIFGNYTEIGRSNHNKFNRNIFDVQVLYFTLITEQQVDENKDIFFKNYEDFCQQNSDFTSSLESNTSSKSNYSKRFSAFETCLNKSFGTSFNLNYIKND